MIMTPSTSGSMDHVGHHPSTTHPPIDEALGWEGHVNVPSSPALTNLLRHWSDLQTGLAFSMMFVMGVLVGGALFAALGCSKKNSNA